MSEFWDTVETLIKRHVRDALNGMIVPVRNVQGSVPPSQLPPGGNTGTGYTPIPATTDTLGGIVLAGDLTGVATAPQITSAALLRLILAGANITITGNPNGTITIAGVSGSDGSTVPDPNDTYVYLVDNDGAYMLDSDGAYLYEGA